MNKDPVTTEDEAREKAINWSYWVGDQSLSMGELLEWQTYFEEIVQRFPDLEEEFKENAIL